MRIFSGGRGMKGGWIKMGILPCRYIYNVLHYNNDHPEDEQETVQR
jgi:hypothetical protein